MTIKESDISAELHKHNLPSNFSARQCFKVGYEHAKAESPWITINGPDDLSNSRSLYRHVEGYCFTADKGVRKDFVVDDHNRSFRYDLLSAYMPISLYTGEG